MDPILIEKPATIRPAALYTVTFHHTACALLAECDVICREPLSACELAANMLAVPQGVYAATWRRADDGSTGCCEVEVWREVRVREAERCEVT